MVVVHDDRDLQLSLSLATAVSGREELYLSLGFGNRSGRRSERLKENLHWLRIYVRSDISPPKIQVPGGI
jgi:hypothetical protein